MELPGLHWLKDKLSRTDEISGGYQARMGHPVSGGAGFAMSAVYVMAWLLALLPMILWQVARLMFRRASGGSDSA